MTYLELLSLIDEMIEKEEVNQFDKVSADFLKNILNKLS